MLKKKIITGFLVLVLVLQIIPIKQVIEYFFIKNTLTEELVDCHKSASKNLRLFDEDHKSLPPNDYLIPQLLLVNERIDFHYTETLPALQVKDIQTPPPNLS